MADREALQQRLLVTFKVEAREHTAALSSSLIELENAAAGPERAKLIELVFREAHSLKGAARAVGQGPMETVCRALESVFSEMKRETLSVSAELLDVLLRAVRVLEQLLSALDRGESGAHVPIAAVVSALGESISGERARASVTPAEPSSTIVRTDAVATLEAFARSPPVSVSGAGAEVPLAASPERLGTGGVDMVRVSTRKLERVRVHAEELFAARSSLMDHAGELQRLHQSVVAFRKSWQRTLRASKAQKRGVSASREPSAERRKTAPPTGNVAGPDSVEAGSAFLEDMERRAALLSRAARRTERSLCLRVEQLLGDSLDLLMLPCSWLVDGFRHMARDLGREQKKDVALVICGGAIEVDRRILTELRDPFLHALRNAVDHGIEPPEERLGRGKPSTGTITIAIEHVRGNRIEIRITDDGRGIHPENVRAAALRVGLVTPDACALLDTDAVLDLIFQSDLSTSITVSDLSGRGLGLAIVREKVEKLGGTVSVASEPLVGTTICMLLPVSIATFRGVVVRVADRMFVLPTTSVQRVLGVSREQIRSLENREAVEIDGQSVALVRMADTLGLPSNPSAPLPVTRLPLVVVRVGQTGLAFAVDEIIGERDALAKDLGPHLRNLPGVLGASQVGAGKIALILDPRELVRRAAELEPSALGRYSDPRERAEPPKRSILIAEDSITSRTLLKGILESAGYSVATAVDGLDAFEKLRGGDFDLLVSDVDMPRLNGIGLTQRVRADKKLAELPVVLVTSLESDADRERGIDVGANAYLAKQSFDQSNLLAAVERLL